MDNGRRQQEISQNEGSTCGLAGAMSLSMTVTRVRGLCLRYFSWKEANYRNESVMRNLLSGGERI